MTIRSLAISTVVFCGLLISTEARAASGYVQGRLMFYQNQGNFCPTNRDCTSARYLQSSFNTNNPVSDAKVYLKNEATGSIIGQGTTDVNGYYTISWSSTAFPINGTIYWTGEHKDNRFAIRTDTGGTWLFWTTPVALTNGTTAAVPQQRGTLTWGSSGGPNRVANVYDGAWRMWAHSLVFSNRMVNAFSGLVVRAFSADCPTSCALGASNVIKMDATSMYKPQARIMHEMGHIASYKSNPFLWGGNYEWPNTSTTGGGWGQLTTEWKAASYEEGLATFFGDVALYWASSPAPHTCNVAAAACTTGTYNVEASAVLGSGCVTNEDRFAITVNRYLRDTYDTVVENAFFAIDNVSRSYFEFFDVLAQFPNGTADGQDDEPWNSARSAIDNYDGRSADDHSANFYSLTSGDDFGPRRINCLP